MNPLLSRNEFTLAGTGGTVLLVHGLGGGPYELQLLGEHVHRELGLMVRAIQLPGHRAASTLMPHSTWPEWLSGVEAALAQLEKDSGDDRVHVVAFSMGSLPSLRLAEAGRLRGSLAVLAPFFSVYRPGGINIERGMNLTPYVPRRKPPLANSVMRQRVLQCVPFDVFSTKAARSALELAEIVLADAHLIQVPTLVLQGDSDTVVDPGGAEHLAARLVCPRRFRIVRGSDHLLALDEQREEVFAEVTQFLRPQAAA